MLTKFTVIGALAACLALGVAACGGADETTEVAAVATKSEFIAQGDAILCTKTKEVAAATASVDPNTASRKELKSFVLDGVVASVQKSHDDLAALQVPAGDGDEIGAMLAEIQSAIDTTEADPAQLITGPDPFARADGMIAAYGLTGCPT